MIDSLIFSYYVFVFLLLTRNAIVREMVYVAYKSGSYLLIKHVAFVVAYISHNTISYISRKTRKMPDAIQYETWTLVELT
jgi:hypothetical protein